MTAASFSLKTALREHLPRLASCEGWVIPAACLFFCMHALLFLLLQLIQSSSICKRLPLLQRGAWPRHGINRLCAILHSSVATVWGLAIVCAEGGFWRGPSEAPYFGGDMTELQRPMLLYSLSFFVYDMVYVLIERDIPTSLHHAAALCGLLYGMYEVKSGAEFIAGLTVGECSTPLLHLRYFARHYATLYSQQKALQMLSRKSQEDDKKPLSYPISGSFFGSPFERLNIAAETAFVSVFVVARSMACPCVTLATVLNPTTPVLVKIFASTVCFISFFWLCQIGYLIYKRGTAGRARPAKDE